MAVSNFVLKASDTLNVVCKSFSKQLTANRKAKFWSGRELCRQTGISPGYLHKIQSGKHAVGITVMLKLVKAFGVALIIEK